MAPRQMFVWGKKRAHVPGHFYSYVTTCQPTQTGLLRPQRGVGGDHYYSQIIYAGLSNLSGQDQAGSRAGKALWGQPPLGQGHRAHGQQSQKMPPYSPHLLTPHHSTTTTTAVGSGCLRGWSTGWQSGVLFIIETYFWSKQHILMMQNCKGTKMMQRKVSPPPFKRKQCYWRVYLYMYLYCRDSSTLCPLW